MDLPASHGGDITFTCNLCGTINTRGAASFHREIPDCAGCGSTPRFRGLALALSEELFGQALAVSKWPNTKQIMGMGMSDWEPLSALLQDKFSHTNTFFHTEPQFDVMAGDPSLEGKFDYVICSEVFEHVVPPLERGVRNLRKLLKPGGRLIFSTPFTAAPTTTEHFPGMRDFRLCEFDGTWVLVAKDSEGHFKAYDNLIFHGGPGTVVEMRVFGDPQITQLIRDAGFSRVRVWNQPNLTFGYYWPSLTERPEIGYTSLNYIISATGA